MALQVASYRSPPGEPPAPNLQSERVVKRLLPLLGALVEGVCGSEAGSQRAVRHAAPALHLIRAVQSAAADCSFALAHLGLCTGQLSGGQCGESGLLQLLENMLQWFTDRPLLTAAVEVLTMVRPIRTTNAADAGASGDVGRDTMQ